jgi:hypothetical protein
MSDGPPTRSIYASQQSYDVEWGSSPWGPTAAGPFLAEHLKSMKDYPPSPGADTLSVHKAIESAMAKLNSPGRSSN